MIIRGLNRIENQQKSENTIKKMSQEKEMKEHA